jgi:glycosyltransferase involved in cell wall biosynthesis
MLADEWLPLQGGLSAFNRYLSIALVRAGADVSCLLPEVSVDEVADAATVDITLVKDAAAVFPGGRPDAVVGHGRVTGELARTLTGTRFTEAARLHLVHAAPDEVGWHKPIGPDPVQGVEERTYAEVDLCVGVTRVLAVGPRLHDWLDRDLPNLGLARPGRLDPGFDGATSVGRGPLSGTPQILVLGRMSDHLVKGLDIAARAVGYALDLRGGEGEVELLVRGVPAGRGSELRAMVETWASHRSVRVLPRNFTLDLARVRADITRATVMVMPSRAEGFGLVGLEAISLGTPALVSGRSGLGTLLREVLPGDLADQMVVPVVDDPVRDTRAWGHAIAAVLRNRDAAFATATTVARIMAATRTWSMAAEVVLATVREARGRRYGSQ